MGNEPNSEKPEWWLENERIRESMGLPEYEPPRFNDDVYVHEVVVKLETEFECEIQIMGLGTDYLDDWEVRLDGETAFTMGRIRNEQGNTLYQVSSETFEKKVRQAAVDD